MENSRRKAFDAAFKLKAIDLAINEGNRAVARNLGINESMVRRWRHQREELSQCNKTTKAFRGNHSRWPELENFLEDWVNTQRAGGRGVSTVQMRLKARAIASEMKIENFKGGPSWCFRFMQRKALSVRARTTVSATSSRLRGKTPKLLHIYSRKNSGVFHQTRWCDKHGRTAFDVWHASHSDC